MTIKSNSAKIFGIPLREAITIGGLLVAISVAWATSQSDIKNLKEKYHSVSEQIREFRKEYREDMRYLRRHVRRGKNGTN